MSDDLDVLEPEGLPFTWRGKTGSRELLILPLSCGQLPKFARAVKPIAASFPSFETFGIDQFLDIVAEHGEKLIEATAIGSGLTVEELSAARPDKLIPLALLVVKVNADFFARFVLPALVAIRAGMPPNPGDGPTPSAG